MWSGIMAVNSFFIWPVSFIFLVYSIGRLALFFEWKLFVIAVMIFALSSMSQIVISIISD
jgi:hypothetical protein